MDIKTQKLEKQFKLFSRNWHVLIPGKVLGGYSISCILMRKLIIKSLKKIVTQFQEETLLKNY